MRAAWLALGLCVFASGCGLVQRATCNIAYETRRCYDSATVTARYHRWAKEAWAHTCAVTQEPYSPHFAQGFLDGFLDYLEAGGSGEPPAIPPRRFWTAQYQTVEGRLAIDDWFAGFRHGAAVARDAGYRNLVTIPSSFGHPQPPTAPPPAPPLAPTPMPAPSPRVEIRPPVQGELLPRPQPIEDAEESEPAPIQVEVTEAKGVPPAGRAELTAIQPEPKPEPATIRAVPGWGLVDVTLGNGITIKWPAHFKPARP